MKKWTWVALLLLVVFSLSCAGLGKPKTNKFILMASTIGPIDAGIVDVWRMSLKRRQASEFAMWGRGQGRLLEIARKGNVDLVMVHAKSLEEKFVSEGFGTERIDLMYNDFVIVGPPGDPAGIKGMKKATEALKRDI